MQSAQGKRIWENTLKAFRIIHPGIQTTIQDQGRHGLMGYGIPPSGAMDQYSYRIGNLLLENDENAASLETTLHGLIIEAVTPMTVAITGGNLTPYLNRALAPQWVPLAMAKGDQLHFKRRTEGFRAYLAVRGGLEVPEVLGSRSTFARGHIGAALKEQDVLNAKDVAAKKPLERGPFPKEYLPDFGRRGLIRVLMGPQDDYYTARGIDTFLTSPYRITAQSDRMAYRTKGPPIEVAKGPGIITEPIPRGAIQVPGDGKPIILLRDAQVTGGYAKIATVISADLDRLGQMMPGDMIHFQQIDRDKAIESLFERKRRMEELIKTLRS
jgi:antagonist of KipI